MQSVTLTVVTLHNDGHGGDSVDLKPARPLSFTAGQHAFWRIPGGGVHPFTIASAPGEELVTLGTSLGSGTPLKRAIAALEPGSRVRLLGPIGAFTLRPEDHAVVMLAQGIGVTPFRSMLRHLVLSPASISTTLVHVGDAHPFRDDTEPLAGRSEYARSRHEFGEHVAHLAHAQPDGVYMVSGAAAFVSSTTKSLTAAGIPTSRIRTDKFYGYHPEATTPRRVA